MDDKALVEATLRGDMTAFEQLVRRYQAALTASACHLICSVDDAEDLAQETMVEAFKQLRALREPEKFRGWLFVILRSKCLNYLKRRKPELSLDEVGDVLAAPPTLGDGEVAELLNQLPFPDRELLAARYLQGLEYEEIAGALGIKIQAARTRCQRARERLRHLMEQADEERTRLLLQRAMHVLLVGSTSATFTNRVLQEVHTMHTAMALQAAHGVSGHSFWSSFTAHLTGWKVATGITAILALAGTGIVLHTLAQQAQKPGGIPTTQAIMPGKGQDTTLTAPGMTPRKIEPPILKAKTATNQKTQITDNKPSLPVKGATLQRKKIPTITLSGKVLTPDGLPANKAIVAISIPNIEQPITTKTDTAGAFSVKANATWPKDDRSIITTAYLPGFAITTVTLQSGDKTITLKKSCTAEGMVVNEAGQPIAGAIVRVSFLADDYTPQDHWGYYFSEPFEALFTTKTDADGHWRIADLPKRSQAHIILEDPRYAEEFLTVTLPWMPGVNKRRFMGSATITAVPAATITGKVFAADGKPAVGYRVCEYLGTSLTAQDGSYRLNSLRTGDYSISILDPTDKWRVDAITTMHAVKGQVTTVPDIILPASYIEGIASDLATGVVLKNCTVSCALIGKEQHQSVSKTDTNGHFRIPVTPGDYTVTLPIYDTVLQSKAVTISIKQGEQKSVSLRCNTGLVIAGTVVNEYGNLLPGISFRLRIFCGKCGTIGCGNDKTRWINTRKDGSFSLAGLPPGHIRIDPDDMSPLNEWMMSLPMDLDLPTQTPINIIMRRREMRTLTGSVVTPDGKPVPDADVSVQFDVQNNEHATWMPSVVTTTDKNGLYEVMKLPLTVSLQHLSVIVMKPGYQQLITGEPKFFSYKTKGVIAEQVLKPCTGMVAGTVVTPEGAPASGITLICAEAGAAHRVVTGHDGKFTLNTLPVGEVHLVAANADSAGYWQGQTGETASITLSPVLHAQPHDTQLLCTLLKGLEQQPHEQHPYTRDQCLSALAMCAYDQAATWATKNGEPLSEYLRVNFLHVLAEKYPERAAQEGEPLLNGIITPTQRLDAALTLGLAVAKSHPELGAKCYTLARDLVATTKHPVQLQQYGDLIKLAGALKNGEADTLVEQAVAYYNTKGNGAYANSLLVRSAAAVSPQLAEKIWSQLKGDDRYRALENAAEVIAGYDITEVKRLEAKTRELYPNYCPSKSTLAICAAQAKTDADGAFAKIGHWDIDALKTIAPYLPKEKALKAYREAFSNLLGRFDPCIEDLAWLTVQINALDPTNGADAYKITRRELQSYLKEDISQQDPDLVTRRENVTKYARYCGTINPLETRLLLEAERAQCTGNANYDYALAIAPLDLNRAFTLVNTIDSPETKERLVNELFHYILASATERIARDAPNTGEYILLEH